MQKQVPELISDEVQAVKGDLGSWLHLLDVADVSDETHSRHDEFVCKRPLFGVPTIKSINSGNMYQCICAQGIRRVTQRHRFIVDKVRGTLRPV